MPRLLVLLAALLGLGACGANFHGLTLHTVQRQTPDIPMPPNIRAGRPDWQGVYVELRSPESFRAHAARQSMTFSMRASLCDSADTTIATLARWNRVDLTGAWDVAGELDQHLQDAHAPPPYRYWLGLNMVSRTSRGRDLSPNPSSFFVDHDLRTAMRGICIHGRGWDFPRGEWFTNVVFIPAEVLREVANQPPPGQPSAPTSPRR